MSETRKILMQNQAGTFQDLRDIPKNALVETAHTILWDEAENGPFPDSDTSNLGGWVRSGDTLMVDGAKLTAYNSAKQSVSDSDSARKGAINTLKTRLDALDGQADLTAAEMKETLRKFYKFLKLKGLLEQV